MEHGASSDPASGVCESRPPECAFKIKCPVFPSSLRMKLLMWVIFKMSAIFTHAWLRCSAELLHLCMWCFSFFWLSKYPQVHIVTSWPAPDSFILPFFFPSRTSSLAPSRWPALLPQSDWQWLRTNMTLCADFCQPSGCLFKRWVRKRNININSLLNDPAE